MDFLNIDKDQLNNSFNINIFIAGKIQNQVLLFNKPVNNYKDNIIIIKSKK